MCTNSMCTIQYHTQHAKLHIFYELNNKNLVFFYFLILYFVHYITNI